VHVNAHATSTPQGDVTEASSIRQSLGEHTEAIVTATKSMTGHLLGGAGALESLAALLALYHRKVPPTINLDNPEPDLGIDIATKVRDLPGGDLAAINNSFGFGGHNVAVAFTNAYAAGNLR
ncbi:MAG TPA: beta-ketoacyl-ACP synthase, partial [Propionibacteriaceae bacterium]|nr:beta-ketoacyl-ACP synthase [Propionibacteriaceae bacterium]